MIFLPVLNDDFAKILQSNSAANYFLNQSPQTATFLQPTNSAVSAARDNITLDFSSLSRALQSSVGDLMRGLQSSVAANTAASQAMAREQMAFQSAQNKIAMDFNSAEASRNRDWQEMMSNTAHQREIADLKAAGLNPVLSATGGNGAAVTSGATASGVTSSGAMGQVDLSQSSAIAALMGNIVNALASMHNTDTSARASLANQRVAASATRYGADRSYEAQRLSAATSAQIASDQNTQRYISSILSFIGDLI